VAIDGCLWRQELDSYHDGSFKLIPRWGKMHCHSQGLCWKIIILQWIYLTYDLRDRTYWTTLKWWNGFVYFVHGLHKLMKSLFWNLKVSTFKCVQSRNWIDSVCIVTDATANYHALGTVVKLYTFLTLVLAGQAFVPTFWPLNTMDTY
jgi:hypothetical protein